VKITVVGGGVAGLAAALKLGRLGHEVKVLERDPTPMPPTADEAFDWVRRGAPQVRHSHAFLARLRSILATSEPDVLEALLAAGATEMPFGKDLPETITNYEPAEGDEELVMIACRRTTFEWVLRKIAIDEGNVSFEVGRAVVGLVADESTPPVVSGVRLDDGTVIQSDLTVVAAGRRSALPDWLEAIGVDVPADEEEDTGIVYLSRFYRLDEGQEYPPRSGPAGGDLGYVKYGIFVGDNRTFSLTLAVPTADDELRRQLADPDNFEEAGRRLNVVAPYLDGRATPLSEDIHVMAGLINRWREHVIDGEPLAIGVIPIGDAALCTNPLQGRGCSTGYWGAHLLTEAIQRHGDDVRAVGLDYDEALRREILPWYRATVTQDAEARRVAAALLAGEDPDGDVTDPRTQMRAVFRDGLLPALSTDAVVLRAFIRNLNMLSPPDALLADPDVGARVFAAWEDRANRPPAPPMGPATRSEFLQPA
jgi:2-polyprenyl-6-methoxyphenol hydroxylase-like FAD-dependent oxidoreductase